MAIHIADAYVDIHARDHTRDEVERIMQRLRREGPVEVGLKLRDETRAESERIMQRLRSMGPVEIGMRLSDETRAESERLIQRLRSLGPVEIPLRLDNQARVEIERLEQQLRGLSGGSVRIRLLDDVSTQLRQLEQRLQRADQTVTIRARLDTSGIDSELARLQLKVDLLGGATVRVELDDQTEPELSLLVAKVRQLRQRVRIRVELDDRTGAELAALMARFGQWRERADERLRVNASLNSDPALQALLRLSQASRSTGQSFDSGSRAMQIFAGVLYALPAASAAVSGALTLGLGAALTAIPVMAWKSSDQVKAAWKDLWEDTKVGIQTLTPKWEEEVSEWTDILRSAGRDWKEPFGDFIEQIRDPTSTFFAEFLGGTKQLQPMLDDLGRTYVKLLDSLGEQAPEIFAALGDAVSAFMSGIEDNPDVFGDLIIDLAEILELIGNISSISMDWYDEFYAAFQAIGPLNDALKETETNGYSAMDGIKDFGSMLVAWAAGPVAAAYSAAKKVGEAWALWRAVENNDYVPPDVTMAMGGLADNAMAAGLGLKNLADGGSTTITVLDAMGMKVDDLKNSLDELTGTFLSEREATRAFEKSIDDLSASIKKNGNTHDENTEKGRANAAALDNLAKKTSSLILKQKESGASIDQLNGTLERGRSQYIKYARQMGYSAAEAAKMWRQSVALKQAIDAIPPKKKVKVDAETARALAEARRAVAVINAMRATIKVSATTPNGGKGVANADGNIWGPGMRSFADGTEQHVAQIAPAGAWRLWAEPETGGEAYIPLSPQKRERSEAILAEVARRFGLLTVQPMAAGGLTDSFHETGTTQAATKAMLAEMRKALSKLAPSLKGARTESAIESNIDKLIALIKKNFAGTKENNLIKAANAVEKKMLAAAASSEKIADTIKEAMDFAESTAKNMLGFADLGSLGAIGSAADIKSGLQFRATEMKAFADKLSKLASMGLNKNLLVEIVNEGPAAGGVLADMLLKDTAAFAAINSAQSQIDAAAKSIGMTAADAMYDTGSKAADGFLTGLKAQQAALDKIMASAASALVASVQAEINKIKVVPGKKPKKKARGGWLGSMEWALVGEEGPEMIRMGAQGGTVIPTTQTAAMLGGGAGVVIENLNVQVVGTFDFSQPDAAERISRQIGPAMQEELRTRELMYR